MIVISRVYGSKEKGFRILVDRLWPRGLTKDKVNADIWMKEVAPSDKLRNWFSHDEGKWDEFKEKYKKELKSTDKLEKLKEIKELERKKGRIILLFGARDEEHNQAAVLKEVLENMK
ncbi:MAG: DUF488 domain-containing protein [Candidatus Acidifodinimicrobium sp.]